MGLDMIKGIGPATKKKLDKAGIRTLEDLRQMNIDQVQARTGIAEDRLKVWRTEARLTKVLDDVKGVGPAIKKKLQAAGVHNLDDLVRASIHEVAEKTNLAESRVREWQKEAKKFAGKATKELRTTSKNAAAAGKRIAHDAKATGEKIAKDAAESGKRIAHDATEAGKRIAHDVSERVRPGTETTPGANGTASPATPATAPSSKPGFLTKLKELLIGKPN